MTFVSTSATRTGEASGTIAGDLTFTALARPVTFDVVFRGGMMSPLGTSMSWASGDRCHQAIRVRRRRLCRFGRRRRSHADDRRRTRSEAIPEDGDAHGLRNSTQAFGLIAVTALGDRRGDPLYDLARRLHDRGRRLRRLPASQEPWHHHPAFSLLRLLLRLVDRRRRSSPPCRVGNAGPPTRPIGRSIR